MNTTLPQQNSPDSSNLNFECPQWYPDLPHELVSKAAMIVLWDILSGQSFTPSDDDFTEANTGQITEELKSHANIAPPDLVRRLLDRVYPTAEDKVRSAFLRGMTEALIVHQFDPLPRFEGFHKKYPQIVTTAQKQKSLDLLAKGIDAMRKAYNIPKHRKPAEPEI